MHTSGYEDDLTGIKGIGPSRQQWLRESFDVRTFRDLAALSVDDVVSQLKAEGRIASRNEVEAWIEQAQKRAAASGQPLNKGHANSPEDGSAWKPFASFVVEFQARNVEGQTEERRTTAHYMEADTDARWPGIENVQLCRWMLGQIGEEPRPELQQQLAQERTQALEKLEEELREKRRRAEQELEEQLEQERSRARQKLQQELEEMRTQARQRLEEQLEEERARAQQELEEEQTQTREALAQAQQELERELEKEEARARHKLDQELQEKRRQAERELEQKQTQARQELQEELEEMRTQAQQRMEEQLDEERARARRELEREQEEIRAQARQELEPPLEEPIEEEEQPASAEPEEKRIQLQQEPEEAPIIEMPPAGTSAVDEQPISLSVTQVRAVQPPDAEQPTIVGETGQPFYGILRGDAPFALKARFELSESAVAETVRQEMTYNAQFYVRDLSTGTKLHLGNTQSEAFFEGKSSYTATLSDITLPAGVYRLSVLVTVQNRYPSADYFVMPVLQVA